jgi:hypothetical protein
MSTIKMSLFRMGMILRLWKLLDPADKDYLRSRLAREP